MQPVDVRNAVFGRILKSASIHPPFQNQIVAEVRDLMVMEMKHIYDLLVFQTIDDIHTRSPLS